MKAKGARSKVCRRGRAREDFVLETVCWDADPARLLCGRARSPVFVTHHRPGPGKVVSPRGMCPDTGLGRLSYGQARALLDEHTAARGAGHRLGPARVPTLRPPSRISAWRTRG